MGERRIGVAISDVELMLASPLTTVKAVPMAKAIKRIATLVEEHMVSEVVVGLPLTLDGTVGPQARTVQSFAAKLEAILGSSVQFFDERLTSVAAEQMLCDLGVKPSKRRDRIDEVAASIILQDYLDHLRNQRRLCLTAED